MGVLEPLPKVSWSGHRPCSLLRTVAASGLLPGWYTAVINQVLHCPGSLLRHPANAFGCVGGGFWQQFMVQLLYMQSLHWHISGDTHTHRLDYAVGCTKKEVLKKLQHGLVHACRSSEDRQACLSLRLLRFSSLSPQVTNCHRTTCKEKA